MALKPGILTDWPWKPLGSFKYLILAPWVVHSTYSFAMRSSGLMGDHEIEDEEGSLYNSSDDEVDIGHFLIFPFVLFRILHNQIWISVSRHRTATKRIVDKGIEFDQVDRESNWDDQIVMTGIIYYMVHMVYPEGAAKLPIWRTDSVILAFLLHAGPVEFLYYWIHRALHHHYLYSRYHSHHHSSIATQPITSVIHPFAETMVYIGLFAIPEMTMILTGTASLAAIFGYIFYVDFMNNLGHCNFEFIPTSMFSVFPPLKYIMYTPSFHSLHHTQFRTNYSLFMPMYDYIYGTTDKSSDLLHESCLNKAEECPNVVHLTHLTTPESIFHLRLGSSTFSSISMPHHEYDLVVYWFNWPSMWVNFSTWLFGPRPIVAEKNTFKKLISQTWVLPKYKLQYHAKYWQSTSINECIEKAILEADEKGAKVLSLGLLNQGEELNRNGEMYVEKHPNLKVKVVDGSSLAAAVVLSSIPHGTTQLLLIGNLTKVATALVSTLCHKGIQVSVLDEGVYNELKSSFKDKQTNLVLTNNYNHKVWLVGDGMSERQQLKASEGTLFIPFNQFPSKRVRNDCFYHSTPAMLAPKSLRNLDSCEDWLPRRALSAWRVAGIVHALEGWDVHECGRHAMFGIDKVWQAALLHGFRPLSLSLPPNYN